MPFARSTALMGIFRGFQFQPVGRQATWRGWQNYNTSPCMPITFYRIQWHFKIMHRDN